VLYAKEDSSRAVFSLLRAAEYLDDTEDPIVVELRAGVGWLIHQLAMEQ
jgi:hypothetical protein